LEESEQQQPDIVDIDEIPSPQMILVNSTPILEEIQHPEAVAMKVDTPAATQQPKSHKVETQKEVQLESIEEALEFNGTTQNPEATVEPDGSQTTILEHLAGETVEDASTWP
jgi:hypothetical protein